MAIADQVGKLHESLFLVFEFIVNIKFMFWLLCFNVIYIFLCKFQYRLLLRK